MFECKCCGECCRDEMQVYLNPDDLLRMAEFLNYKNTKELFTNSVVLIDCKRNGYPLPRIRFSKGFTKCCPFLENNLEEDNTLKGYCLLHPNAKPLVCSLAPLYRSIDLKANTEVWGFLSPLDGCPGGKLDSSVITPPEHLKQLLNKEKAFFKKLSQKTDQGYSKEKICSAFYYIPVKGQPRHRW